MNCKDNVQIICFISLALTIVEVDVVHFVKCIKERREFYPRHKNMRKWGKQSNYAIINEVTWSCVVHLSSGISMLIILYNAVASPVGINFNIPLQKMLCQNRQIVTQYKRCIIIHRDQSILDYFMRNKIHRPE